MIVKSLSGGGEVTLREIGKRQGLKVTPYLASLVSQLVADGQITRQAIEGVYPTTHIYALTDKGQDLADLIIRLYGDN
jgi:DNA-binding HxlR family transcriptional regulator